MSGYRTVSIPNIFLEKKNITLYLMGYEKSTVVDESGETVTAECL